MTNLKKYILETKETKPSLSFDISIVYEWIHKSYIPLLKDETQKRIDRLSKEKLKEWMEFLKIYVRATFNSKYLQHPPAGN
jgi:hypothetical protein